MYYQLKLYRELLINRVKYLSRKYTLLDVIDHLPLFNNLLS